MRVLTTKYEIAFNKMIFLFLILLLPACSKSKAASAPPVPVVEVTEVVQQDVPIYSEFVATLDVHSQ